MLRGRSLICCRSFEEADYTLLWFSYRTPPCVCGPDVIEVTWSRSRRQQRLAQSP
jgi:hypothetical protein